MPLQHAVQNNNIELAELLLDGARSEYKCMSYEGMSLLWIAATLGHVNMVRLLLQNTDEGFRIRGYDKDGMYATPLFIASCCNHVEVVHLLLQNSSPDYREVPTQHGVTPLMGACLENNIDVVKLLLDGARPEYAKIGCEKVRLVVVLKTNPVFGAK
eukprot:TRINITY_DN3618_c0_g2_i2.p1 TRINITY_DN3618_c0_g2~~TRINITY_DN3618_c0_g2_i2.p1  ORF type:complete len:169 (+),score=19.63 TRINITY_DN3618_c0_g2_i2:38-508(+)